MKLLEVLLAGSICSGSVFGAVEKFPAPPAVKGWRKTVNAGTEKSFKPVLGDDFITFGNKTLKLQLDGSILCINQENGALFSVSMPFYTRENGINHDWNKKYLDRKNSRIIRKGNKYIWDLWYKRGSIKPFKGIDMTLEVLSDGRVLLTSSYQLPEDTPEFKLRSWTLGFNLPEKIWKNETVNLDGDIRKLDDSLKRIRTGWNQNNIKWEFGSANPAKKFSIQATAGKKGDIHSVIISRQTWGTKGYRFTVTAKKNQPYKLYFDFRKGLASRSGSPRGGVNFKTVENMTLPDIHNKNMITNPSLECNLEGWHSPYATRKEGKWYEPVKLDSSTAYDGKYSMQFSTGLHNWHTIAPVMGPIRVIAEPGYYTLSFYAKGEPGEKDIDVYCWISDFHTNSKMPLNKKCKWKFDVTSEWKRYTRTFYVPAKSPVIHISFYGFCNGKEKKFWIDAVQMEKGRKATAYAPHPVEGGLFTSSPDNFISSRDRINGKFVITTAKPGDSGDVKITVTNFFGEKVLELDRKFKTNSDRKASFDLPLDDIPALGVFIVKAEYKLKNGATYYDFRRYSKIEFQNMPRPNKRMFALSYRPDEMKYDFLKVLDRWQKLGVGARHWQHTTKKEIWDIQRKYDVEPFFCSFFSYKNRNTPNIQYYIHDGIRKGGDEGTNQPEPNVLIRDFHRESNGRITPKYLEKLKQVIKKQVSANKHIPNWGLCGELTCKLHNEWWGKNYTDNDVARCIAKLLQAYAAGVKEANPNARICSEIPSNMGQNGGIAEMNRVLGECGKLGVKFDIIGIHIYRYSPENPDLDADTAALIKMLSRHGYKNTPIIWSEGMHWGPFDIPQWGTRSVSWQAQPVTWHGLISYDMGWTEKKSAAWYARAWLVALKYSDRIIGATAGNTEPNCYMDMQLTPYAAQLIPNTLCSILGDAKFKKDIRFAPYIRTYVFEDAQKRPVAVVWNHHENVDNGTMDPPEVTIKLGDWMESIRDLMNSERSFTRGKMRFAATPFPLFFRGKPGTLKQMISAFENVEMASGSTFSPLSVSVLPQTVDALKVKVSNSVSREFSGTINGAPLKVASSGETVISIPLKNALKADKISSLKNGFTIKNNSGRTYRFTRGFDAFAIKRVADGADINTVDWQKLPELAMKISKKGTLTSGKFRMGWNQTNLFIEVKIKDNKFVHVEYKKPDDRWKNDSLQIYFDTFANARDQLNKGYDMDDYVYGVFPNSKGNAAQVFRYRTVETQLGLANQAPPDKTFAPDIPCTFTNKNGVQTYRMVFPAKYLLPIKLHKGWVFGFGLFAPNSDAPNTLQGSLTIASDGKGCSDRPHNWPAVILAE